MSIKYQVTWPKDMRDHATSEGKALLGVGYSGKSGRNEFYGPCDDRTAQIVFMLAMKMHHGMSMDDAVAETKQAVAQFDERQAAKAAHTKGD